MSVWTSPSTFDFELLQGESDHPRDLRRELERRGERPDAPWGAFPQRFVPWAVSQLHAVPTEVLHLCSGGLGPGHGRARVDLRRAARPDVVADARRIPFPADTFAAVLIDPPYTVEYARDLYGTEYPRPSHLLAEAARVVRPCGRIGILHFLVPMPPPRCRLEKVRGVTTGMGYRIRAYSVFVHEQDSLSFGA